MSRSGLTSLPGFSLLRVRRGLATPPPSPLELGVAPALGFPRRGGQGGKLSPDPHLGSPGLKRWGLEACGSGRAQRYQWAQALVRSHSGPRPLPAPPAGKQRMVWGRPAASLEVAGWLERGLSHGESEVEEGRHLPAFIKLLGFFTFPTSGPARNPLAFLQSNLTQ